MWCVDASQLTADLRLRQIDKVAHSEGYTVVDGKSRDELDTVLKAEFVKIYAHNLAYRVLLHNLVSHVAKTDPQFVAHLRRQFDSALGMELGEKRPTDVEASRIEARAVFMDILDRIKIDTQKPSLRRRFLNWLERD